MKGTWAYADAARLIAHALGNRMARSIVVDLGVSQITPFERAASAIARGDLDVALVVGGEAKWRALRAAITGTAIVDTDDTSAVPDEFIRPHTSIIAPEEIAARLVNAVSHYAMIENARRAADGQSLDDHAREVAELWARFNVVARSNPLAWNPAPMSADEIRLPGPKNRPIAFPYNKWHNSQMNIDQAAGHVLCSVAAARAHGVPEHRWLFPHAIVQSNHVVPVSRRGLIHRSPGFAVAGATAFELAGLHVDELDFVDLYSCFPIAVRTQVLELGLDPQRSLTVTGGMAFSGGPLDNYVLQSTSKMAQVLREHPGTIGLVTAISGMITKQAVSIWSTRPPDGGYRSADVTDAAATCTPEVSMVADARGAASVATYTVIHGKDAPERGVIVADVAGGGRSIAITTDANLMQAMTEAEWCGRAIELDGAGGFVSA
jgi:acetyl-CoA C-acetyltransferase